MPSFRTASAPVFILLFSLAVVAIGGFTSRHAVAQPSHSREFEFTYQVHVPPHGRPVSPEHLWIPLPIEDQHQWLLKGMHVTGIVQHRTGTDAEYGNHFYVFAPTPEQVASGYDAGIIFTVNREEYVALRNGVALRHLPPTYPTNPALLERYLQPDKLVPLNGVIARLAQTQTAGASTPLEKARKIYDYVVSSMHYDHNGDGWGRGDAVWACDSKHGNCTDFHSVFIGMMRASGIPARFGIGFQIPQDKTQGHIPGYHCWSEFYVQGLGWIPVDASEASQHPAKKDYFFGAVDPNRVLFTYGRDIRLSPDQKSDPLNYFIYPYAESDGQPIPNLEKHFSFREVPATSR